MKLLIHHHAIAYVDSNGIWMQAFLGKWIIELSKHFEEIGLLLHESKTKLPVHDTCIKNKNVSLNSLGQSGTKIGRIKRRKNILKKCDAVSKHYDILLIRGMTRRQYFIYKYCNVPNKVFLLVCSIYDNSPSLQINLPSFFVYFFNKLGKYQFKKMSSHLLLLANSPTLNKEIKKFTGFDSYFVSTSTVSNNDRFIRPDKNGKIIYILFVGRLVSEKGLTELIEAIKILNKDEKREYHLNVIGKFNDEIYKNYICDLIISYRIQNKIIFQGFVPYGKKLFERYKRADVLVLPSYHEGFSQTIWEAFITYLPVITTNVGGVSGFLTHEKEALLISPRKSKEIAKAVLRMMSDHSLKSKLVKNGYQMALQYTVEKSSFQLKYLLEKYVNKQNSHQS